MARPLSDEEYSTLAARRRQMREELRRLDEVVRATGMSPRVHELLLAVRGCPDARGPRISDAAGDLGLTHNGVLDIVGRAEYAGLLERVLCVDDARARRLRLTTRGYQVLDELTEAYRAELATTRGMVVIDAADDLETIEAKIAEVMGPESALRRALRLADIGGGDR